MFTKKQLRFSCQLQKPLYSEPVVENRASLFVKALTEGAYQAQALLEERIEASSWGPGCYQVSGPLVPGWLDHLPIAYTMGALEVLTDGKLAMQG